MIEMYIAIAGLAIMLLYAIVVYNGFVNLKHGVAKDWSNIDVLLKQRHDELPKLVETCKQYMQFERDTLEKVMRARRGADEARAKGDVKGVGAAEGPMRAGLDNIVATVEAYPELRANQSIQTLLARITGLENSISDRRELYNEAVNIYNVRTAQFPDLLIARLFGFGEATLLLFSEEEKADVNLQQLFRS